MDRAVEHMTFVVRLQRVAVSELVGVVERVRTGEKARFRGLESIGAIIARMVAEEVGQGGGS